ncbi:ABC transporter permease [Shimia sp. W99]
MALILREMAATYGRSPGGYVWAIIEPVAAIALMSFVFSFILRSPSLGSNFPIFYATGFLPFVMYSSVSGQIAKAIQYSKPLLTYPAVTFMDALLARFLLNTLTHLLVMFIVIDGIITFFNLNPILNWPAIFTAIAMAVAMAVSVGVLNCYLASSFPLWERLWAVLTRPMFILSGVLFIPENVPARFRDIYMLNPVAHITSEMRKGFYATYDAVYVRPTYVFLVALVLAIFGLLFLLKNHKDIVLK